MLRDFDFSFARSSLALNHPPQPDNDPILHTLPPPQQPSLRNSTVFPSAQPREVGKGQFVNITLGNSPEYGNLQSIKPTYTISNFNRQIEEARRPPEPQPLRTSAIKSTSRIKEQPFSKRVQVVPQQSMNESKTERQQVRASRATTGYNNQHTVRNPRQDTLQPKKTKFLNRQTPPSGQSPDKLALVNKIEELKLRVAQGQNLSRTLGMQLQITREKLKVRESEHALLQGKLEDLAHEAEAGRQTERVLAEQRRMNEFFCEEIDKQKAEVVRYQQKNEQSLRLLQQLNMNITRRQEKLQREMAEQTIHLERMARERTELQQKIKESQDKVKIMQAKVQNCDSIRIQNEQNALRLDQQQQQRQRELTEVTTSLKISKEEAISLRASLQEIIVQKDRLLMEVGKLTEENSHIKEKLQTQSTQADALAQQSADKLSKMTLQQEEVVSDLKARLAHAENQVQGLFYSCKERQTKLQVANTAINDHLAEIKELKEEKRILMIEKEELKGDVKHLLHKNDEYYAAIQAGKRNELALNTSLADLQREIITLEERISENITAIADRDINIATLNDHLAYERLLNEQKVKAISERNARLIELQQKLRKYQKMLSIYKQELGRLKDNKEKEWQEMRIVYEDQIAILQEKLKEFLEGKERRSKAVMKRREVIEETVTSTSFAVHQVETEPSIAQEQTIQHD